MARIQDMVRAIMRAPRRHRLAAATVLVALVVIVLPIGWYLGSPLVLSTTIDEPPPIVAAATPRPSASIVVEPSSPAASSTASTPPPSGLPAATPVAPSPSEVPPPLLERSGRFRGADDFHFGSGTARLIETSPGEFVVRLEDFAVRNGPDLFVYLSPRRGGYADDALELGRLKADRGNQNYRVPAGTDVADARSVVIWCRQFSQLFAVAPVR